MSRQKNIFTSKKKQKLDSKKVALIAIIFVITLVFGTKGIKATTSFLSEQREKRIEMKKKAEEERILAEKKRKEEEERKKMMIGVGPNGKSFADDASKVAKQLATYDYSNDGKKVVYLTFDDGTSTTNTPSVLNTLKENDVKATFFITGQNLLAGGQKAKDLLKQELEEGHAIANHSFTHDYNTLYPGRTLNIENFKADFEKTDELLKDVLGPYFSTRVLRCPGGYMSWRGMDKLDTYLEENNKVSIDWNALNGDAEGKKKNADELVNMAIKTSKDKNMVVLLMHDTYGKEETAKALPKIIKYFKDNGYEFRTLV